MSLLKDIQDYLRRYKTATQPELAQQFAVSAALVEMAAETLRAKGRVRFKSVLPSCGIGGCSGSCKEAGGTSISSRTPVRVYEWVAGR